MRKDPTEFRKRFAAWQDGKMPYKAGRVVSDENNISDQQYVNIMEKVAADNYKQWGFENDDLALLHALNDNTYNYIGYYNKYPNGQGNAIDHWTDEFKTVWHPTFSDESIYSGKKSQYNPKGLKGGHWLGEKFIPAKWQGKPKYKDGKGYVKVGNYNVYPSAIGASELNVTTPEVVVTGKDRRPAWKKMYQNPHLGDTSRYYNGNVLEDVVSFVPGLSDAVDGVKAVDAANRGDYLEAGILGAGLLLPNIIEKPLKFIGRPILKFANKFVDDRILKNIQQVNSAEKVEELFKSRMPYANNNSQYVEPMLSTKEYNLSVIDDITNYIRHKNPHFTDEEIRGAFIKETHVSPEDLLNALGFVYRDNNGVVRAASYTKGMNPKRTMYTKTHEWNHTGFDFEKRDPKYTWIETSEGGKNYLNENQGFTVNDVSDEDGLYLNADEVSSYMSEIKTMLGKKGNLKLTARELDFLNKNRRLMVNNLGHSNIYNFIFDHIKDTKKFAKWVNDNATVLTVPVVGGIGYGLYNNE